MSEQSQQKSSRRAGWAKRVLGATAGVGASVAIFGASSMGCLDRPVVPIIPGGSGVTTAKIRVTRIDKVDLLIVVDNSISMADKQSELSRRMPELVASLTDPTIDPATGKAANVLDMHVGVITSSLGSHGTSACNPDLMLPKQNDDKGWLLPRAGDTLSGGYQVSSPTAEPTSAACPAVAAALPVSWVFDPAKDPNAQYKGADGATTLQIATACTVNNASEKGCGYEETWEAAYHFLVDPAPYTSAKVSCQFGISGDSCGNNKIIVEGLDQEILNQRAAFLRPDSLVAVIVLSDENDASLKPAGLNWLPWGYGKGQMQKGWDACANVPDDFEPESGAEFAELHTKYGCFSCFENGMNPNCTAPWATDPINNDVDGRNLRAFHQTQRYGYNFLWSRQRYVDAFTKIDVLGSDGQPGKNPLFKDGVRTPDLIIVAAIVGVPKQLLEEGGKLLAQPLANTAWEKIVGPLATRDPHMVESVGPRAGVPKFAGDRTIDPVNGGDRDVTDGDDLQYACIEKRSTDAAGNDCLGTGGETKNPLCGAGGTQPYFKAYPGLRHLRIVKDLGASGFVASICNSSYRPAIQGITEKLKAALNAQCITSDITAAEGGNVNCLILEAMKEGTFLDKRCEDIAPGLCTPGDAKCRLAADQNFPPVSPEIASSQLVLPITFVDKDGTAKSQPPTPSKVEGTNVVIVNDADGKKHLVCELVQLAGGRVPQTVTDACINDPAFKLPAEGVEGGWCFSSKPEVVGEQCIQKKATSTIRFLGGAEPRNGSEVFTLCLKGS